MYRNFCLSIASLIKGLLTRMRFAKCNQYRKTQVKSLQYSVSFMGNLFSSLSLQEVSYMYDMVKLDTEIAKQKNVQEVRHFLVLWDQHVHNQGFLQVYGS